MAGRSSMEIGVRVEAENYLTVSKAYSVSVPDICSR